VALILGAATIAMVKTLNSTFLIFSRYLFAMGRAGVLPTALARIHPRFGTPHVACIVAFLCGTAGLFLPSDLVFLLLAVNIPTMLKYLATCLCAWIVVSRHKDIYAAARLKLGRRAIRIFSVLGIVCAIAIILFGLSADWRPYLLIAIWGGLGLVYWMLRQGAMRRLAAERISGG
jgi:APA family basic amino acid/polyamine antiporter